MSRLTEPGMEFCRTLTNFSNQGPKLRECRHSPLPWSCWRWRVGCIYGWLDLGDHQLLLFCPWRPTGWCHQRSKSSWLFALQFVIHLEIHWGSHSSPSPLGCWTSTEKGHNLVGLLSQHETINSVPITWTLASCFLYSLASKSIKYREYPMSIIVTSWELKSNAFLKTTKHLEWLLVALACLVHQYSEIHDLVSCPPSLSESRLFVCSFCFHSDPFQYDLKKDLACMWNKSIVLSYSVQYILLTVTQINKSLI